MSEPVSTSRDEQNGARFLCRSHCQLCGRTDLKILFSEDFGAGDTWDFLRTYYKGRVRREVVAGTPYEIRQCRGCGFIWQARVLSESWSDILYEQWISPEESLEKERTNRARADAVRAGQVSLIPFLLGSRKTQDRPVLDFGMGWGSWCLLAAAAGFNAYAVELSPSRISYGEANGVNVIQDLSQCQGRFEYVNAEQVLEHVSAPVEVLRVLASTLQPNGLVRIGVPDGRKFLGRLRRGLWRPSKDQVHPLEHVNCFTHRTLVGMAGEAGLTPISQLQLIRAVAGQLLFGKVGPYHAAANLYLHFFGTGIIFQHIHGPDPGRG